MSADNMPPLPVVAYSVTYQGKHCSNYCERLEEAQEQKRRRDRAFGENGREVVLLVTEADARAYADSQVGELVEASKTSLCVLCALLDANDWHPNMRKDIEFAIEANRALIAKHTKDQA